MKLAVISDLHADVRALADALAQIERLGCDEVVCAGDVLDYGRFPERTIALLQERRIPTIRGNHERWALSEGHDAGGWRLTTRAIEFLESLPASWTRRIDDVCVAVWHARPRSDMKGIYPDASAAELASQLDRAEADVLVVGHTHVPFARFVDRRLVCNPGALLRDPAETMEGGRLFDRESGKFVPAPAAGGGTFGVLESPTLRFTVHRARDGMEVEIARGAVTATDTRAFTRRA
jgi:putative phosphoesterase